MIGVICEWKENDFHKVSFELIGKGRELADKLNKNLICYAIGKGVEAKSEKLIKLGADIVYICDADELEKITPETCAEILTRMISKEMPEILLCGATLWGREVMPRIAVKLNTGLSADVIDLKLDEENKLIQVKPAFGSQIMAEIYCEKKPQMTTVRYKVFEEPEEKNRKGKIIKFEPKKEYFDRRKEIIEVIAEEGEKVKLEDAEIIVAGGRGLQSKENFEKYIFGLAEELGAAVGATRPPVDEGWISYHHQIGQTGKTVRPRLYIAIGISGAIQHTAGIMGSGKIIAINKDESAPIFKIADIGIVGDLFKIIPELQKLLKK